MRSYLFILLAFLLSCASLRQTSTQPGSGQPEVGVILSLTDFHFDPFYDPTLFPSLVQSPASEWTRIFDGSRVAGYGEYGKDSNYNLLVSALRHAALAAPKPDFIGLAGDWLAHGFSDSYYQYAGHRDPEGLKSFIDKTMVFLTLKIREQFPHTPVYPALGNEDSYCGDYQLQPNGEFLHRTAETWKVFFDDNSRRVFEETFPTGGYYAVSMRGAPKHRLLVLNTVFFSADYQNRCGTAKDDPAGDQLYWLAGQLKDAATNGDKVWLIYHIPYGIDAYNTGIGMGASKTDKIVSLWRAGYTETFLALLEQYRETIRLMLAGHTHMDYFRLGPANETGPSSIFLLVTPGISPIFGNNPGLHVLSYNRKAFSLLDYTAYSLDLTAGPFVGWKEEYRFSRTYGLFPVTAATLRTLSHSLKEDARTRATYIDYYNVGGDPAMPQITEATWSLYWCSIGYLTAPAFQSCVVSLSRP